MKKADKSCISIRDRENDDQMRRRKVAGAVLAIAFTVGIVYSGLLIKRRYASKKSIKPDQSANVPGHVENVLEHTAPEDGEKGKKITVKNILTVIFAVIIIYSGLSVARYYRASVSSESGIEELKQGIAEATEAPPLQNQPEVIETEFEPVERVPTERIYLPSNRFIELYERNNELAGWITIEGTKIDYPVMLPRDDEEFYLDHNFDGDNDPNGLPFLDIRCEIAPKNQIQIIYGHNIKTGIMFHDLMLYESEEFWREHQYITYDTIYDSAVYQIVAAFVFNAGDSDPGEFQFHRFTEFYSEKMFAAYKRQIDRLALYDTGVDFSAEDQYIIVATCEYTAENGRFVLIGKQVS